MFFLYVQPACGIASFVREYETIEAATLAAQQVAFEGRGKAWVTARTGAVDRSSVVYESPAPLAR